MGPIRGGGTLLHDHATLLQQRGHKEDARHQLRLHVRVGGRHPWAGVEVGDGAAGSGYPCNAHHNVPAPQERAGRGSAGVRPHPRLLPRGRGGLHVCRHPRALPGGGVVSNGARELQLGDEPRALHPQPRQPVPRGPRPLHVVPAAPRRPPAAGGARGAPDHAGAAGPRFGDHAAVPEPRRDEEAGEDGGTAAAAATHRAGRRRRRGGRRWGRGAGGASDAPS
mmetsp:Transcript_19469/g.61979  ORF Transcript_19469/g.61979 Transcript_19469/m.61979 type:complete len:223 (+) Transcript_19469:579-1247(+)